MEIGSGNIFAKVDVNDPGSVYFYGEAGTLSLDIAPGEDEIFSVVWDSTGVWATRVTRVATSAQIIDRYARELAVARGA